MNKKYDKSTIIKCILIIVACVIVYIGACFLDHQRGTAGWNDVKQDIMKDIDNFKGESQ